MSASLVAALCFTGAWLVITTYFLMGSVPLLILEHDTPMDARFVRGFFNTYYVAAMFTAGATAVSYALAGRPGFAVGTAGLTLLAALLRRTRSVHRSSSSGRVPSRHSAGCMGLPF